MSHPQGSSPRVSRIAQWLLRLRLPAGIGAELLDDLDEEFQERQSAAGRTWATLWYLGQAFRPTMRHLRQELNAVRARRAGGTVPGTPVRAAVAVWRDWRPAGRRLLRSPGFSLTTIAMLAVGIGATVAMYSVVDGVVLQPLPYPAPERLVWMAHTAGGSIASDLGQSHGTYALYRDLARSFEDVTIFQTASTTITGEGNPERVEMAAVTRSFFDVFAVPALHGRVFTEEDDAAGGPQVVVLSERLWRRRYGGDPRLVGRTIEIGGTSWEVVGIMPTLFQVPMPETDVWFPQQIDFATAGFGGFYLSGVGRLVPGITVAKAGAELQAIAGRISEVYPEAGRFLADVDLRTVITPLRDHLLGGLARTLWIVLGGVGLVLLIACANVANLFLVRGEGRAQEVRIRGALGASRTHFVRDALAESLWLVAVGTLLGWGIGRLCIWSLGRMASIYLPRFDQVTVDWGALAVVAGLVLLSCTLSGAFPLVRRRPGGAASEGTRSTADRTRTGVQRGLAVFQVAVALLLLACAGLLARSFRSLQRIDPGFDAENVLTFELQLPGARYPSRLDAAEFIERLRLEIEGLPGIEHAGTIACLPLRSCSWANRNAIAREDAPVRPGTLPPSAMVNTVSPGYFEAMGIPVIAGRLPDARDFRERNGAVVIDRALADRFWPNGNALGKRVYPSQTGTPDGWYTVVGVVESVRNLDLMSDPAGMLYLPQVGTDNQQWWTTHLTTMAVRAGAGDPLSLVPAVRAALARLDPNLALAQVHPMRVVLNRAMARPQLAMMLLGLAAAMALSLALVGVYGVMSYVVAGRRGEMGIRLALGATAGDLTRIVLRQAGWMSGVGIAIGLAAALSVTRVLRALLYQIEPTDLGTLATVALVLLVVMLGAAYVPSRRAATTDPAMTLRDGG